MTSTHDDYDDHARRYAAALLRAAAEDTRNEALDPLCHPAEREALAARTRHWCEAAAWLERT